MRNVAAGGSADIEGAILVIGEDVDGAACWVTVPEGWTSRFEAIGRDDDGGFLRDADGEVFRIGAREEDLDDLLGSSVVEVQELDRRGELLARYEVEAVPYGSAPGFGA